MATELFNKGISLRREVLGAEYVDKLMENIDEFSMAMQEYATETAWGMIWSRPGLERRTRRIMVLAITASMGRWEEFELHIRTGLLADPADAEAAPLDLDTIREVLLQTAVYAGVPAGNTGMAITVTTAIRATSTRQRRKVDPCIPSLFLFL